MIGVGVAAALLVALLAAWAIDGAGARTARRLELGGRDAGHLSKAKLQTLVTELAGNVAAAPIELAGETGTARSTAGALGLSLNEADTVQRALKAGRAAPLAIRPFQWLAGLFSTPRSALRFQLDRPALNDEVTRLADKLARAPIEPSITAAKDELRAVPGRPGSQPDIEALANQLTTIDLTMIDEPTRGAVTVLVAFLPRAPRSSDSDAKALVSLLTEATAKPMTATLAKESRELEGGELRALIRPGTKPGQLSFELDPEGVDKLLKAAFDGVGTPSKPARLEISAGRVAVIEGTPGDECCAVDSADRLQQAIAGARRKVDLALASVEPTRKPAELAALGIKELVGEFTTRHDCCAPRVKNLHRMADLVQGMIIQPGEAFSLNDAVGRRTTAKGFVAAPTINGDGNFEDDIGGGVSQFATTLFNAAFFGGFDIPTYMAHGLYISRYPYGREATLSYPSPDLRIRNNTPYGVLIWPTYTDTTITIGLYSTAFATGEQVGQSEVPVGTACVGVTTVRKRTFVSGETRTDRFYAEYAPAEGVQCDGSKRDKDGKTIPTTTTSSPTTTTTANPQTSTTEPTSASTSTTASMSTTSSATTSNFSTSSTTKPG